MLCKNQLKQVAMNSAYSLMTLDRDLWYKPAKS